MQQCPICGRPITPGQPCVCQTGQVAPQPPPGFGQAPAPPQGFAPPPQPQPPAYGQAPPPAWGGQAPGAGFAPPPVYTPQPAPAPQRQTASMIKGLSNNGLSIAKGFFKAPASTLEGTRDTDSFKQGLFFYACKAILMGILVPISLSSVFKSLTGSSLELEFSDFLSMFLRIALFSVLADAVWLAGTIGGGKAMKSDASPKCMVGTLGVSTIPMTVSIGVSLVLCMVSLKFGLGAFAFLCCYCLAISVTAVDITLRIPKDKLVLALAISFAAIIVGAYLGFKWAMDNTEFGRYLSIIL